MPGQLRLLILTCAALSGLPALSYTDCLPGLLGLACLPASTLFPACLHCPELPAWPACLDNCPDLSCLLGLPALP